MNILFDVQELVWGKVLSGDRPRNLPKHLKDSPMWENLNDYRVLIVGNEPPRPGEIWSCILTKIRRSNRKTQKRLLHRVIKLVGKSTSAEYDKTISEMIDSNDIPYGTVEAKGRGQIKHYGETPVIYTIKMPSELRYDLQIIADQLEVSLNRVVVTLIDIGKENWDEEEIRY